MTNTTTNEKTDEKDTSELKGCLEAVQTMRTKVSKELGLAPKATVTEFMRLIQLERELEGEVPATEVTSRWIDPKYEELTGE